MNKPAQRPVAWSLFVGMLLSIATAGRSVYGEPTTSRTPIAVVFGEGLEESRRGVVHDLPLELRAEGFEVPIFGKVSETEDIDRWAERARSQHIRVMIHVFRASESDASIEILLVEPDGLRAKSLIRYQPATSNAAVLSAVEVTRAALLSTLTSPQPESPETAGSAAHPAEPRAASRAKAAQPAAQISVGVFPAFTLTGSTPVVLFNIEGAFSIWSDPRFSFDLHAALPVTSVSEERAEGTFREHATWMDTGLSWRVAPKLVSLRPFVGARTGVLLLSSEPATPSSIEARTDPALFVVLASGVSLRLDSNARVRVELAFGFTAPKFPSSVTVTERFGQPLFQFAFGPEFGP